MTRCLEVSLAITDNEALTALATLQQLGVEVRGLERSDLYRCEVEPSARGLAETLGQLETIYNPNKHVLRERDTAHPDAGEVWIGEAGAKPLSALNGSVRLAGRALEGVRSIERFTAWRLLDAQGRAAEPAVVSRATDALLCNPAFQRAVRA
jgi:hypothetical protein